MISITLCLINLVVCQHTTAEKCYSNENMEANSRCDYHHYMQQAIEALQNQNRNTDAKLGHLQRINDELKSNISTLLDQNERQRLAITLLENTNKEIRTNISVLQNKATETVGETNTSTAGLNEKIRALETKVTALEKIHTVDCSDIYHTRGERADGVYTIYPTT